MAEKSVCRSCFHSYVCEQFNKHRDSDNKKCFFANNHFVPAANVIPKTAIEQLKWERNTAIEQLESYGVGFCEKKKDLVEVVRCKDCKNGEVDDPDFPEQYCCHAGCGWNRASFYCGYGERKEQ